MSDLGQAGNEANVGNDVFKRTAKTKHLGIVGKSVFAALGPLTDELVDQLLGHFYALAREHGICEGSRTRLDDETARNCANFEWSLLMAAFMDATKRQIEWRACFHTPRDLEAYVHRSGREIPATDEAACAAKKEN